jgi:hypothetical protein
MSIVLCEWYVTAEEYEKLQAEHPEAGICCQIVGPEEKAVRMALAKKADQEYRSLKAK